MFRFRILMSTCLCVALAGALVPVGAQPAPPKPKDGPLGMEFVPLPKGTTFLGWNRAKGSAKKTEIKEDFEIAVHEVTQGQWQELMGKNPSAYSRGGDGKERVKDIKDEDLKQFPVEQVSWNQAQEFIKKLNEKEAKGGYVYRLPSAAEWEYACRGGATSVEECSYLFYFAKPTNDLSAREANCSGANPFSNADKNLILGRATKVGSYAPNKLGLYDMHGNVREWCEDPFDSKGSARVDRGGGWNLSGTFCQAGARSGAEPAVRSSDLGFRLARVPVRPK